MQANRRLARLSATPRRNLFAVALTLVAVLASSAVALASETVAVFKIRGPVAEQPDQSGLAELLGDAGPVSMAPGDSVQFATRVVGRICILRQP